MNRPLRIGLTGNIGSGKSLVIQYLNECGVPVLQTDEITHQLLQEQKTKKTIVRLFGETILDTRGNINRRKLAQQAFSYPIKLKKLNSVLHPKIRNKVSAWVNQMSKLFSPFLVVVEVPLLFETGYNRWFDRVLCISASKSIRKRRLLKKGWTSVEIRKREKFQWDQKRKKRDSTWVIRNDGSRRALKNCIDQWLERIIFMGT
jgi:dephospho-CoA kinase